MVLVDRIVAHADRRTVERVGIGVGDIVEREAHQAVDTPRFAVVGIERQKILRGELVVGEAQRTESQFGLEEIKETQRMVLRLPHGLGTSGGIHIDHVHIVVVALDRPVDHVLLIGQFPVGNHHLAGPHPVGFLGRNAVVVDAAAGEHGRIVPLGLRNRYVTSIILQDGDIGQVLHDVVRRVERLLLASFRRGVHTHIIGHAQLLRHIAQLRGVDQHAGRDALAFPVAIDLQLPHAVAAFETGGRRTIAHLQVRLAGRHALEEAVADRRLEHRLAHPSRTQGLRSSVMVLQLGPELVPDTAAQHLVAVRGAHAGRGQHAAQPVELLDDKRPRPETCGLQARRHTACAAADDHHIILTDSGTGHRSAQQQERGPRRKDMSLHSIRIIVICGHKGIKSCRKAQAQPGTTGPCGPKKAPTDTLNAFFS